VRHKPIRPLKPPTRQPPTRLHGRRPTQVHDSSYKRLFSNSRLVEDLLRGFVHEDWIKELDFTSLEKVNATFVADDFRERRDDLVWKVRWGQDTVLFVYLLLEFQADVDKFMAVRVLTYLGLLYQDLIKSKQLAPDDKLPPVLPIVLYRGRDQRWNAPQEIHDLLGTRPAALEKYTPKLHYLLLDEGSYSESQLTSLPLSNLVTAMFQLENSRTIEDFQRVITTLVEWLTDPSQQQLNRDFTDWLTKVLLAQRLPGVEFKEITNLEELKTMLAERIDNWQEQWKATGIAKGRAEGLMKGRAEGRTEGLMKGRAEGRAVGLSEGRAEGRIEVLRRLLEEKFGPLTTNLQDALYQLEEQAVFECVKRTLTAKSVQEVLGQTPPLMKSV
jgi:predicted transposase YdaD